MTSTDHDRTTIAAISTPPGAGGIGIIRISGNDALPLLRNIFTPADHRCRFESHRLYYGTIVDPRDNRLLDEALAVFMGAPRTYTREDVVELHCHGSFLVLESVLDLLISLGAQLAAPGEFTKRAFLNGRIDLTRAEAVIDILSAKTRKGVDLAVEQMSGTLYRAVDSIRSVLVKIKALLEVAIDFPEEDVEIADRRMLLDLLDNDVLSPLRGLIDHSRNGRMLREGALVAIVGRPNVGKSSLLNALLQQDRALVTAIAGTTRDTIEEYLDLDGLPVRLVDTAGIRADAGEVELLGIKRARDVINRADLVLFVVDGSQPLDEDDRRLFADMGHKPYISLVNKADLPQRLDTAATPDMFADCLNISAETRYGLDTMKRLLFKRITGGSEQWQEEGCAPNFRQKVILEKAERSLHLVREGIDAGLPHDLVAIDLLEALTFFGDIVGETTPDDVLDVIFNQFCLGK